MAVFLHDAAATIRSGMLTKMRSIFEVRSPSYRLAITHLGGSIASEMQNTFCHTRPWRGALSSENNSGSKIILQSIDYMQDELLDMKRLVDFNTDC